MFSLQPLYPVTINRLTRLIRLNLRLQPLYGPAMLNSLWAWWQQRLIRLNLQLQPPFSLQPLYPVINRLIRLNLQLQPPCSPDMLNSLWVLWQQDLRGLDSLDQDLLQGLEYLDQDRLDRVPRVQDSQGLGLLDPGSNPPPEPIL